MCTKVIINKGEKEIETPREFLGYFGFVPDYGIVLGSSDMDACLCSCDIATSLKDNNISYEKDDGDFYVTMHVAQNTLPRKAYIFENVLNQNVKMVINVRSLDQAKEVLMLTTKYPGDFKYIE